MAQVETDFGTKLDCVAVNHHNTGHRHMHVIVNGRDALGDDLVINGDYFANGIREWASGLATLELGPVAEIELPGARREGRRRARLLLVACRPALL